MAPKTISKANKALEKKASTAPKKKPAGMRGTIAQMEPEIRKAISRTPLSADLFMRQMYSALSENPKLANCTQQSLLGAMMASAQLGLSPNTATGEAYLIPYGNKVQFIIGYKGLINLAFRSGRVESIYAETVYENDFFEYELGWNRDLKHKRALSDRGEPIAFYAVVKFKGGGGSFYIMSVEDAQKYAKRYSPSYNSGPWKTDFEAMAKKTCIRQVLKYAPLGVEIAQAVANDETIKNVDISKIDENFDILDKEPEFIVEENEGFPNNSELFPNIPETSGSNPEKPDMFQETEEGIVINPETGEVLSEDLPFSVDEIQDSFLN